jgi:hypothetical protein
MALPSAGSTIESALPVVTYNGLNTLKASNLAGLLIDTSGNATLPGTLTVTGAATLNGSVSNLRLVTDSALVGATVVLTAAQSGQVFNNRATSGSPSWTLPTAANGLNFTFTVSDVTTGFTVTGGTMKAKTSASGTTLSGTTLTNTQGTAVVNDTISFVCDGTVWRMVAQSGIFALA